MHGEDCIVIVSHVLVGAWRRLHCYSQFGRDSQFMTDVILQSPDARCDCGVILLSPGARCDCIMTLLSPGAKCDCIMILLSPGVNYD